MSRNLETLLSGTASEEGDLPERITPKLADSLIMLTQALYEAEQEGMVAGMSSAGDAILRTVPMVGTIMEGRLIPSRTSRGGARNSSDSTLNVSLSDRRSQIPNETKQHIRITVDALPTESARETQARLDTLMQIMRSLPSTTVAKRLQNHLPISIPQTRIGFLTLKNTAHKYQNGEQENDWANLSDIEQALRNIDLVVTQQANTDEEILRTIAVQAKEEAERRLPRLLAEKPQDIDDMRSVVAQRRIEILRREGVWAGGNRQYSRFEILVNEIIQAQGLSLNSQAVHAKQQEAIERARDQAVASLATKRGITRVINMMDIDSRFREVIAQTRRMSPDELLNTDIRIKKRIANELLKNKRIVISAEERKVFYGQELVEEERRRLLDALTGDPSSLSEEERTVVEAAAPKLSEEKSAFDIAKEILRRKIAAEATEKELLEVLSERVTREFISQRSCMAVDAAIRKIGIDTINSPGQIVERADEITAEAINLIHLDVPPITLPNIQLEGLAANEGLATLEIDQLRCITEQNIIDLLDQLGAAQGKYGVKIQQREGVKIYMIDQKTRETLTQVSRLLSDLSKTKDTLILPSTENEMSCLLTMVVDAITTGEPITIVTPICPAWSRDAEGKYDFKSLGGDESFIARKFFTYGQEMLTIFAKHHIPFRGILLFADWGLETEIDAKDTFGRKLSQEDVQMCFQSTVAATDEHLANLQADEEIGYLFRNYAIVSMRNFLESRIDVAEVETRMRIFFTTDAQGKKLLDELNTLSYGLNRMRLGYNEDQNREFALQNLIEYSTVGQSVGPHSILAACESRTTSRSYNLPRQKHENVPVFYVKGRGGADEGVNIL